MRIAELSLQEPQSMADTLNCPRRPGRQALENQSQTPNTVRACYASLSIHPLAMTHLPAHHPAANIDTINE